MPAPGFQWSPAVAFDGLNFLVVWTDCRSGTYYNIYGSRVTRDGVVLDPSGIAISVVDHDQWAPAVAFDGTNFAVVWQDTRNGDRDIYGARVAQAGVVLDPSGIPISTAAHEQSSPDVVFDGTDFAVVWGDHRKGDTTSDIYGARLTRDGVVLDPSGIAISTAPFVQGAPALAYGGADLLVVWTDFRRGSGYSDIYGARVTPSGAVRDPDGIVVCAAAYDQRLPAIAFDGTNFLAAWSDERNDMYGDIYGARVTQDGVVLDPSGIAIATSELYQESPALVFDGANFVVAWADFRDDNDDVYASRLTPGGTVLDSSGIAISTAADYQDSPTLGFDGTNLLAAWRDFRNGEPDVYGARVTATGVVLDTAGTPIATSVNYQETPAATSDGTNYLAVWTDSRNDDRDVFGVRIAQSGVLLDSSAIAISSAVGYQGFPSIAFDGTNYLVVWVDHRASVTYSDIYGARVSQSGSVLDPLGIPISTAAHDQISPKVSFDGANFIVVWTDYRGSDSYADIYGARVTSQGTVLDPSGFEVTYADHDQESPALAFDGTNSLVVWTDHRDGSYYSDIFGARVTGQGIVLDPGGIAISTAQWEQQDPAVTFDGLLNYLVVWWDRRDASAIYAARVTQEGVVLDTNGIPVANVGAGGHAPAIASDGTNMLALWEDNRIPYDCDIYGARVTRDGVVFDSGRVVTKERDQLYPALARGSGGHMLLVYQGWTGVVGDETYDVDRVWGKVNPAPGVEEDSRLVVGRVGSSATIVRGTLLIPTEDGNQQSVTGALIDVSGREVRELHPGQNSTAGLAPGVYFVRGVPTHDTHKVLVVE